jgi:predicted RNase H-like HicB family nuclease
MRYTIVIERGPASYGAYVPDLPGCVAAAETESEVLRLIREAMIFHLDAMREEGLSFPEPLSSAQSIEVAVA